MANIKKKKIARKTAKRYEMVEVKVEAFDAPFILPSPKQMPMRVSMGIRKEDIDSLTEWFAQAGVDQDYIDAFLDLSGDEVEEFFESWKDGDIVVPKSSES